MLGVVSKINPLVILRRHFGTFGDAERNGKWMDVVLFYILPVCVGLFVWQSGRRFDVGRCADAAVNVLAIFIPLAFSVLVELMSMMKSDAAKDGSPVKTLAGDLYWNVSYGILAATVALCALLAVDFLGIARGNAFAGAFAAAALHFLLTALMVCKRFAKLMDPVRPK